MKFDTMEVPDRRQFLSALPESVAPNPRRLARMKFAELPEQTQAAVIEKFGPQEEPAKKQTSKRTAKKATKKAAKKRTAKKATKKAAKKATKKRGA